MEKLQENTLDIRRFLGNKEFLDVEEFLKNEDFTKDIKHFQYLKNNRLKAVLDNKLFECAALIHNDNLYEIALFPIPIKDPNEKYSSPEEHKKACVEYSMNALKSVYGEPSNYTYKVMQFKMLESHLHTGSIYTYDFHSGYKWDFDKYQILLLTLEGPDTSYAGYIIIGFK